MKPALRFFLLLLAALSPVRAVDDDLFARKNLVAWCIVPFDTKKRGPAERAEMVARLGLTKIAYDWREEHVPQFEQEILEYQKRGLEFFAFWDLHEAIFPLLEKYKLHPQIWLSAPGPDAPTREEQIAKAATQLLPAVERTRALGCKLGLYNHGGWGGEPENLVGVCEYLREHHDARHVGIVYNQHHGHDHLDRFATALAAMKPWLLCLNLNGMTRDGDRRGMKILPPGQGEFDLALLKIIRDSGWRGPLGILGHTQDDAELRLRDDLDGLDWLVAQLDGKRALPKPNPHLKYGPPGAMPERAPLDPAAHPLHTDPVNRDRIYDFYAKQARDFFASAEKPAMLPAFPELDSGRYGHWGNQTEETWRDGRWNQMDIGWRIAGVFRVGGVTLGKALCVRLGENGERAACYDPESDEWRALWQGGFVKFSDVRHGLMSGLLMDGQLLEDDLTRQVPRKRAPLEYRGFYQHGKRSVFTFDLHGVEVLMSAKFENGKVVHEMGESLREFAKGGPAQWPQILETQGTHGQPVAGWPYVVDTLTLPFDNPWHTLFFIGGHDFFSNGDIALCTMTGDVWRVSGVDESLSKLRWKRMAAGLHQPLGLVVVDDKVCVLGRDQITRLHDLNGDGEADFYECLSNDFTTPTGGHDFLCGLERDVAGNFYTVSGKDGLLRIAPGKKAEVIASGFRNPDGLGLAPDGTLTVPYSEGEWTPTSAIAQIAPGGYYGYPGPRAGAETLPPLVWLPRGEDNSAGGQTWVPDDRWGPMRGQMLHFSYGAGTHFLVLRQQVDGVWQGAAIPLPGDFRAGPHRARFSPRDGQLYVSGMTGWGTYTPDDGCLQRVRYTGGAVRIPVAFEARDNGVLLTFSEKPDASAANFAQCWNYRYSQAYGSREYSLRDPEKPGHDVLEIKSAHIVGDGRKLFLEIPQLQPANVVHLRCDARDLFLTLHRLGAPFTEFPGYTAIAKTDPHAAHHAPAGVVALPVKWEQGVAGRELRIQTAAGLQFAQKELRAKAGERLSLILENPDVMPHNWVLIKPDAADRIGELANKMIAAPDALARNYVPDSPDILCHTRVVDPQKSTTIHFAAPAPPGRYPYVCTFPGHSAIMRGVLVVE